MAQSTNTLPGLALQAQNGVDADRTTIFAVDHAKREIYSRYAIGLDVEIRLPLTRGLIGFVARTGRSLRLRDAYNDPRFDQSTDERTGYRTRSVLCVPIKDSRGATIGAIQAINKRTGSFSDEDEALLLRLCADAAPLLISD